tara:strand:- start:326 stop:856 length:531 start_codon:yes stop_codon:yes gene_type:complete
MTSQPVTHLNTRYPTLVFTKPLVDASVVEALSESTGEKRHTTYHDYSDEMNVTKLSVVYTCSDFLEEHGFKHKRYKWSMDVIRYNLDNETKRVDSGLAWHCENDNGNNLITVLLYVRLDDTIIDGNLRYKDKDNKKQVIQIQSGTTIIMDGEVPHKPQDPYGTGRRDLIIVSFQKR